MSLFWITGAAGFIGGHLVRHLVETGAQVAGLDRYEVAAAKNVAWQTGPLSLAGLSALAEDTGLPDTIYHLAGGSSVGASLADPQTDFFATLGTCAILLEWLRLYSPRTKLVVISSAAVYGDLHRGQINDGAKTKPFSPYGAHKFAMEETCRGWASSFGLNIIVARLFSVYGPGLTKQLLWDVSEKLSSKAPSVILGGTGEELRDWTHIDDVVRALTVIAPLAAPEMPIINVGSGQAGSVRTIAEHLIRAFNKDPACLSFSGVSRSGDPFSLVAAPGLLQTIGFEWRVSIDAGIASYASWYKSQTLS